MDKLAHSRRDAPRQSDIYDQAHLFSFYSLPNIQEPTIYGPEQPSQELYTCRCTSLARWNFLVNMMQMWQLLRHLENVAKFR